MLSINLTIKQMLHLNTTNKAFIYFNVDKDTNKIEHYILSSKFNIIKKNQHEHFRVLSTLKNEIRNLTINI